MEFDEIYRYIESYCLKEQKKPLRCTFQATHSQYRSYFALLTYRTITDIRTVWKINRIFLIVLFSLSSLARCVCVYLFVCVTSIYAKSRRIAIGKRGKGKKKKRRALMKLLMIGAVLKAKIELLLKIIATHLQIKFFVVAVIGLIINIARFWVDVKRSQTPQKVCIFSDK